MKKYLKIPTLLLFSFLSTSIALASSNTTSIEKKNKLPTLLNTQDLFYPRKSVQHNKTPTEKLRDHYRHVLLSTEEFHILPSRAPDSAISQQKNFLEIIEKTKKIWLQGTPGTGKTQLSWQLVAHWAKEEYFKGTFDWAIKIDLAKLETFDDKVSIEEQIALSMDIPTFTGKDLKSLLAQEDKKGLFILDGYDTIASKDSKSLLMKSIRYLLKRPHITYLLTSDLHSTCPLQDLQPQETFTIRGLSKQGIRNYIIHYFDRQVSSPTQLPYYLKKRTNFIKTIFSSPMLENLSHWPIYLHILCVIGQNKGVNALKSLLKSEIIAYTINNALKYDLEKYAEEIRQNTEYRSPFPIKKEEIFKMHKLEILYFAQLAFLALEKNLIYLPKDLKKEALKLSYRQIKKSPKIQIMDKNRKDLSWMARIGAHIVSDNGQAPKYTTVHFLEKNIQEWFAAYYIAYSLYDEKNIIEITQLLNKKKYTLAYQNIIRFTAGILYKKLHIDVTGKHYELFHAMINQKPIELSYTHHSLLTLLMHNEAKADISSFQITYNRYDNILDRTLQESIKIFRYYLIDRKEQDTILEKKLAVLKECPFVIQTRSVANLIKEALNDWVYVKELSQIPIYKLTLLSKLPIDKTNAQKMHDIVTELLKRAKTEKKYTIDKQALLQILIELYKKYPEISHRLCYIMKEQKYSPHDCLTSYHQLAATIQNTKSINQILIYLQKKINDPYLGSNYAIIAFTTIQTILLQHPKLANLKITDKLIALAQSKNDFTTYYASETLKSLLQNNQYLAKLFLNHTLPILIKSTDLKIQVLTPQIIGCIITHPKITYQVIKMLKTAAKNQHDIIINNAFNAFALIKNEKFIPEIIKVLHDLIPVAPQKVFETLYALSKSNPTIAISILKGVIQLANELKVLVALPKKIEKMKLEEIKWLAPFCELTRKILQYYPFLIEEALKENGIIDVLFNNQHPLMQATAARLIFILHQEIFHLQQNGHPDLTKYIIEKIKKVKNGEKNSFHLKQEAYLALLLLIPVKNKTGISDIVNYVNKSQKTKNKDVTKIEYKMAKRVKKKWLEEDSLRILYSNKDEDKAKKNFLYQSLKDDLGELNDLKPLEIYKIYKEHIGKDLKDLDQNELETLAQSLLTDKEIKNSLDLRLTTQAKIKQLLIEHVKLVIYESFNKDALKTESRKNKEEYMTKMFASEVHILIKKWPSEAGDMIDCLVYRLASNRKKEDKIGDTKSKKAIKNKRKDDYKEKDAEIYHKIIIALGKVALLIPFIKQAINDDKQISVISTKILDALLRLLDNERPQIRIELYRSIGNILQVIAPIGKSPKNTKQKEARPKALFILKTKIKNETAPQVIEALFEVVQNILIAKPGYFEKLFPAIISKTTNNKYIWKILPNLLAHKTLTKEQIELLLRQLTPIQDQVHMQQTIKRLHAHPQMEGYMQDLKDLSPLFQKKKQPTYHQPKPRKPMTSSQYAEKLDQTITKIFKDPTYVPSQQLLITIPEKTWKKIIPTVLKEKKMQDKKNIVVALYKFLLYEPVANYLVPPKRPTLNIMATLILQYHILLTFSEKEEKKIKDYTLLLTTLADLVKSTSRSDYPYTQTSLELQIPKRRCTPILYTSIHEKDTYSHLPSDNRTIFDRLNMDNKSILVYSILRKVYDRLKGSVNVIKISSETKTTTLSIEFTTLEKEAKFLIYYILHYPKLILETKKGKDNLIDYQLDSKVLYQLFDISTFKPYRRDCRLYSGDSN